MLQIAWGMAHPLRAIAIWDIIAVCDSEVKFGHSSHHYPLPPKTHFTSICIYISSDFEFLLKNSVNQKNKKKGGLASFIAENGFPVTW